MKDKKTLYVIDGHALCYRAYFALIKNPLINGAGQNVSAIYGFARMLYRLAADRKPDFLVVAFDPPERSFRFRIYEEYKATRHKMPDDLRPQIGEIHSMIDILGLCRMEHADFEGDDIMGTLAAKYASDEMSVWLVTGDKDAYQLAGRDTFIYAPKKGISEYEIYDAAGVKAKTGVLPEQIIDYMSLTGDASDNIPGISGIGEKTAAKLINEYGSLDNLYANTDRLTGKLKDRIEAGRDMAYLSRELVTIRRDVDLELDFSMAGCGSMYSRKAESYFKAMEMNGIIRDYFSSRPAPEKNADSPAPSAKRYFLIKSEEELAVAIEKIEKRGEVAVDTETTSVFPMKADLIGLSFSVGEGEAWYLPVADGVPAEEVKIDPRRALAAVKSVLENSSIRKIGQNIKYDAIVLRRRGIELKGIYFDTMVASYLLAPNERRHNMDDLAAKYLGIKTVTYKELTGTGRNAAAITDVPLNRLADYAAEDADVTYRLYELFVPKLKENGLEELFFGVEMKLVEVLAYMERCGVKIDSAYFKSLKTENDALLKDVEERIYKSAGRRFNINSTKELSALLFDELKLPHQKKTKTGYSTDISVLETLKSKSSHPIIDDLIMYRTLSKLKGTYIDALPVLVNPDTGRLHTSYNQTVVATGRLSSSDPNLQNIPVRDEFGKQIRKGFVAEHGFSILAADYSQIELRLAAHLSGDEAMIKAFRDNADIHAATAALVFGVDIKDVTSDMRRQAKTINFATIYGVSPFGLSRQADINIREASDFIKAYFKAYPVFRDYIDRTVAFAEKHGYVETILGRRRDIPEINSSAEFRREGAKRMAINTPIQGSSADMIKLAMIKIYEEFAASALRSKMIMQVHDELVFEVHEAEKERVASIVKNIMEGVMKLSVPVVVELGWGRNWEEAH